MKIIKPQSFTGERAWDALDIANIEGATVRLHWTDQPYIGHKNNGEEIFIVLDGQINMHYREDGVEHEKLLLSGDICHIGYGEEHVAKPYKGPARILVIEKRGSI